MLGSVARRILNAAAGEHMCLRAPAGGTDVSRGHAAQQLRERAEDHLIQYSYTMPRDGGGEIIAALAPTDRCEFADV